MAWGWALAACMFVGGGLEDYFSVDATICLAIRFTNCFTMHILCNISWKSFSERNINENLEL